MDRPPRPLAPYPVVLTPSEYRGGGDYLAQENLTPRALATEHVCMKISRVQACPESPGHKVCRSLRSGSRHLG